MASRSEVTDCKLHPFTTRRKPQVHYQLIYVATLPLSYYYLVKALDWTATDTLHSSCHCAGESEYTYFHLGKAAALYETE